MSDNETRCFSHDSLYCKQPACAEIQRLQSTLALREQEIAKVQFELEHAVNDRDIYQSQVAAVQEELRYSQEIVESQAATIKRNFTDYQEQLAAKDSALASAQEGQAQLLSAMEFNQKQHDRAVERIEELESKLSAIQPVADGWIQNARRVVALEAALDSACDTMELWPNVFRPGYIDELRAKLHHPPPQVQPSEPCVHKWKTVRRGGHPADADSDERVTYCVECGDEYGIDDEQAQPSEEEL